LRGDVPQWHELLKSPPNGGPANPSKKSRGAAPRVRAIMLRKLLRLLLLMAVLHHGVALPGSWQAGIASEQAAQHALMHWLGEAHHHHGDDGGVHKHGGSESAQHLQIDNLLHSPALMALADGTAATEAPPLPAVPRADAPRKTAFLALPERPPRGPH
jgi:hypothetical protein